MLSVCMFIEKKTLTHILFDNSRLITHCFERSVHLKGNEHCQSLGNLYVCFCFDLKIVYQGTIFMMVAAIPPVHH